MLYLTNMMMYQSKRREKQKSCEFYLPRSPTYNNHWPPTKMHASLTMVEADINIINYILLVMHQNKKSIQVVADDNDIFALLCHFIWKWKRDNVSITMTTYDGSVIDINASSLQLGEECKDLLAVHALTGCNTTSYPFGKGKMSTNFVKKYQSTYSALEILYSLPKNCIKWVSTSRSTLQISSLCHQQIR